MAIDLGAAPMGAMGAPDAPADAATRFLRPGTLRLPSLPPLSLYVHLPWCLKKCPYCDFNSHEWGAARMPSRPQTVAPPGRALGGSMAAAASAQPGLHNTASDVSRDGVQDSRREILREGLPEGAYIDALCADLESTLPLVWGRRVHSIFIGGGTPSLFSPASIERLLGELRARLSLAPGCEITLEANPGTFEAQRFRAYRAAGVTRLSVGVQSFDDAALQRIGRVHDAAQARAAVLEAREAFETFNIDLMYALPGQDLAALQRDLDTALSFAPPHLSVYHLTLEPNTWFAQHPPPNLPDDDLASDMLDLLCQRTAAQGLQRYEVSAFAKAGHRCAHNLNYWEFGDYLGIGAGAHGKLSFPQRVVRQVRWRDPATYMREALAGRAVSNEDEVPRKDLPFEFMLNALRLRDGFADADFCARTGLPLSSIETGLQEALQRGLLQVQEPSPGARHWRPSDRGFDFLSDLQALFLPSGQPKGGA